MTAVNQQKKIIKLKYEFKFSDGTVKTFDIRLDDQTLDLVNDQESQDNPDWALMSKFRCENCPLNVSKHKYCPVALTLYSLMDDFKNVVSCDKVDLRIETPRRTYVKNTPVQNALSSLMGIYMVTNGCPVFGKLKPMVRYHLPFASPQETSYRIISMYFMAQFFRQRQGKDADWQLEKLSDIFDDITAANRNVCRKFRALVEKDAILNAVVILNSSVDFMSICFDEGILKEIERDFKSYV